MSNLIDMTVQQMAQLMGSEASDREARAMFEVLRERGLEPDEMTDEQFFALIPEAVERAEHITGDESLVLAALNRYRGQWLTYEQIRRAIPYDVWKPSAKAKGAIYDALLNLTDDGYIEHREDRSPHKYEWFWRVGEAR